MAVSGLKVKITYSNGFGDEMLDFVYADKFSEKTRSKVRHEIDNLFYTVFGQHEAVPVNSQWPTAST